MMLVLAALGAASSPKTGSPSPINDDLVILATDGRGSGDLIFVIAEPLLIPKVVRTTDAISASGTIPASDIKADVLTDATGAIAGNAGQLADNAKQVRLVAVRVTVATKRMLDPQASYKARLFLTWGNATYSIATYSIATTPLETAEITPTKVDDIIGWRRDPTTSIRIRNTGRVPIHNAEITSTSLVDSSTQRRVPFEQAKLDLLIPPQGERLVTFTLPDIPFAGSYSGTLDITSSGHHLGSTALTVKTRGPSGKTVIPFLLFFAVAGGGMALSYALDRWFVGGGLARAQAILSLYECQSRLSKAAIALATWRTATKIGLPNADRRIAAAEAQLPDLLRDANHADLGVIAEGATNLQLQTAKLEALLQALKPLQTTDPSLASIAATLDNADAIDLSGYVAALRRAQQQGLAGGGGKKPFRGTTGPANIRRRIRFWNITRHALIGLLALGGGFFLLYYNKFAFGTAQDYMTVLLWSLGLTQTGTQLVTRARWP